MTFWYSSNVPLQLSNLKIEALFLDKVIMYNFWFQLNNFQNKINLYFLFLMHIFAKTQNPENYNLDMY